MTKRSRPHTNKPKRDRNDAIRTAFIFGATGAELVKRFRITRTRVYQICRGLSRQWSKNQ